MTRLIKYLVVPILVANFIGVSFVICQYKSDLNEQNTESSLHNRSDKEGQVYSLDNILYDVEECEPEKPENFPTSIACSYRSFTKSYINVFCSTPKTSNVILFESDNSPPKVFVSQA